MNEILLSVIVPVYNVKPYLERCFESVIRQTYRNLDIIVVDDGSTDGSDAICDEYAKKDDRITLIHKQNGGLSDARNAGLAVAKGDLIGFVDSDDWIADDMYEVLIDNHVKTGADIVVCGFYDVRNKTNRKNTRDGLYDRDTVLTAEEGLNLLVSDKIHNYAWNKIYTKELFEKHTFPVGKTFEDVYTMYKLFQEAALISIAGVYKYYYFHRTGSIANTHKIKNDMERFEAVSFRYNELKDTATVNTAMLLQGMLTTIMYIYYNYPFSIRGNNKKKLDSFIREHKNALISCSASLQIKYRLFLKLPHPLFFLVCNPGTWFLYEVLKKMAGTPSLFRK
ncbi:glycosyl transferase [Spirochaetia bacterium]|nr:glycosyl transferase [Spirochaetia bacterium]